MIPVLRILAILVFVLFALIVTWLLMIKPGRKRPGTAFFANVLFAHRGLFGEGAPENSLPAFRRAMEAGVGIELDVQLSSDGIPVVFHDTALSRVCGRSGVIADYTADELSSMPLLGVEGTGIPRFSEVLALVAGRVPLLVEIKGETPDHMRTTEEAAKLLDGYHGAYCIESFHPMILRWFRRNRPEVIRGQLSAAFVRDPRKRSPKYAVLSLFLLNIFARPDFVAYDFRDRDFFPVRVLRRLFHVPLFAWTTRSEEDAEACRGIFDTVIFERAIPEYRGKTK